VKLDVTVQTGAKAPEHALVELWEGWQVKGGKIYSGWKNAQGTNLHKADTFTLPGFGPNTCGRVTSVGKVRFMENMDAQVLKWEGVPHAKGLPATRDKGKVLGWSDDGALHHEMSVEWDDISPNKKRTTIIAEAPK